MSLRRAPWILVLSLAGCPDAVRATGDADAGATDGGTTDGPAERDASRDDAARDAEAPLPRAPQRIADPSGPLAVSAGRVFVATPGAIAAVEPSGGTSTVAAGRPPLALGSPDSLLFVSEDGSRLHESRTDGGGLRDLAYGGDVVDLDADARDAVFTNGGTVYALDRAADAGARREIFYDVSRAALLLALTPTAAVFTAVDASNSPDAQVLRHEKGAARNSARAIGAATKALWVGAHGEDVYWLLDGGGIRGVSSVSQTPLASVNGPPSRFDLGAAAVDEAHVYWASLSEGRVYRADRATGSAVVFAEGFSFDAQVRSWSRGSLHVVPARRMAVDARFVYVSDARGLYRVAK